MGAYFDSYFSPGRAAIDSVIGFIGRCNDHLDVAVYSLTHDRIADALIAAHGRGLPIRILLDSTQAGSSYSDDERLIEAGIDVRIDRVTGLMHHKFAIDGDRAVGLGSFNWTLSAETRNQENWNVVRLKYAVAAYQERFDAMWKDNAP